MRTHKTQTFLHCSLKCDEVNRSPKSFRSLIALGGREENSTLVRDNSCPLTGWSSRNDFNNTQLLSAVTWTVPKYNKWKYSIIEVKRVFISIAFNQEEQEMHSTITGSFVELYSRTGLKKTTRIDSLSVVVGLSSKSKLSHFRRTSF